MSNWREGQIDPTGLRPYNRGARLNNGGKGTEHQVIVVNSTT